MPESPEQHGDHEVEIGPPPPLAITTQRDVQIVPQPVRESHVPAPPEVGNAGCHVRVIEVLGQFDREPPRCPASDVRVG